MLASRVIDDLLATKKHMYYGNSGLHYAEACAAVGAIRFADEYNDNSNPTAANEGSQFLTFERRAPDPDAAATAFISDDHPPGH